GTHAPRAAQPARRRHPAPNRLPESSRSWFAAAVWLCDARAGLMMATFVNTTLLGRPGPARHAGRVNSMPWLVGAARGHGQGRTVGWRIRDHGSDVPADAPALPDAGQS